VNHIFCQQAFLLIYTDLQMRFCLQKNHFSYSPYNYMLCIGAVYTIALSALNMPPPQCKSWIRPRIHWNIHVSTILRCAEHTMSCGCSTFQRLQFKFHHMNEASLFIQLLTHAAYFRLQATINNKLSCCCDSRLYCVTYAVRSAITATAADRCLVYT